MQASYGSQGRRHIMDEIFSIYPDEPRPRVKFDRSRRGELIVCGEQEPRDRPLTRWDGPVIGRHEACGGGRRVNRKPITGE